LPADASIGAGGTGGEAGVADSGLPAVADADTEDAVYVVPPCGDGVVVLPEQCDDWEHRSWRRMLGHVQSRDRI